MLRPLYAGHKKCQAKTCVENLAGASYRVTSPSLFFWGEFCFWRLIMENYSTSIPKSCFFKMILQIIDQVLKKVTSMSTTRSCPLTPRIHMSTREWHPLSPIHVCSKMRSNQDGFFIELGSLIGEIFGQNRLRSYCLQVQPVTCWHPPVFLRFSFIKLGHFLFIFLQSWTSTGYFSNSASSFVAICHFSLIIGCSLSQEDRSQLLES